MIFDIKRSQLYPLHHKQTISHISADGSYCDVKPSKDIRGFECGAPLYCKLPSSGTHQLIGLISIKDSRNSRKGPIRVQLITNFAKPTSPPSFSVPTTLPPTQTTTTSLTTTKPIENPAKHTLNQLYAKLIENGPSERKILARGIMLDSFTFITCKIRLLRIDQ